MPEIDCKRLAEHLKRFTQEWQADRDGLWQGADALIFAQGKLSDMDGLKSTALQMYLLGYEFSNLIFVVTQKELFVLVSEKRAKKYFQKLESAINEANIGLEFRMLYDKKSNNGPNFDVIANGIKSSHGGKVLGCLLKEKDFFNTGKLVLPLFSHLEAQAISFVEIKSAIAAVFAIKDEEEQFTVKRVSQLAAKLMQKVAKQDLIDVADKARTVTHRAFGNQVDAIVENLGSKPELCGKLNPDDLELSYPTMLRTGTEAGEAFKIGTENSDENISVDVSLLSLGVKYLNYNACVTRTLIFYPSRYQVTCYQILFEAFGSAMQAIVPGQPVKSIYAAVKMFLSQSPVPDLADYLPKFCGHSMGIERSESIRISAKNDTDIMPGMVFFLSINLEGLPNKKKSGTEGARSLDKFSFALGDTVLVLPEKDATTDLHCASLTRGASSSSKSMIFRRREGGSDDEDMLDGLDVDASLAERTSRAAAAGASKEKHTAEKQRKLMLQKKAEYEAAKKNKANTIPSIEDITKQMRMFSTAADYPRRARKLKVFLDTDRETVFIPVNRVPVPFHISTIKSVSYTKQGRNHILRFNFHTTSRKSVDATKIMNHYCAQSQNMTFIKEIMVKSLNPVNLNAQCRQIKEMQKNNRALIKQAIEESNLVAQDRVRLITNPPKLQDLQMKPSLRGRRTTGTLECHHNGLRFRSSTGGERLEFTFKNIRHAMFQPCKKELTVLIHFHLKNPILVGKKKAVDIQFYTEVVRSSEAIAKRASMYDPEEMDAERRQNKLRKRLNELFDSFVKKCEKLVEQIGEEKLQFDVPFRDIGFEGVPHKSKCLLMPTQEALVNLTEQPVFVISLALVDHVHLARCTFKSRHFDMVIIWKDWSRTPATIDMIDRQSLDHIKRWLEDYPLSFTMGPDTLKIKSIMKMAQQYLDEGSFFEEVDQEGYKKGIGWEFLVPQAEEDEDQESDDESEFKSEDESSGSDDEDSDEWEATDEEEESEAEEVSDAEDWDDMEKKAAHEDRKKSQKHDAYEARLEQKEQAAQRRAKRKRRNR